MDKSHRNRIKEKNNDYWTLRNNLHMITCKKCLKYNSIINHSSPFLQCVYCGNYNYIKK